MNEIRVSVSAYGPSRKLVMRYRDPVTGKRVAKSTGTKIRREAERIAARFEDEINQKRGLRPAKMTWDDFRERFENHKAATKSERTAEAYFTALNRFERVTDKMECKPNRLGDVTPAVIAAFEAGLREEKCSDGTVACYLRHLKAALRWAEEMGYMPRAPRIKIRTPETKPRALTAEEFDRMYEAVPKVRDGSVRKPNDSARWQRFLLGLWHSTLRIGELVRLSWNTTEKVHVDISGDSLRIRFIMLADRRRRTGPTCCLYRQSSRPCFWRHPRLSGPGECSSCRADAREPPAASWERFAPQRRS